MVQKIKPKEMDKEHEKEVKKELLGPDEFISTSGRAFQWIQDNSQKVMTAVGVLFAVAAVAGVLTWFNGQKNAEASNELAKALKLYHRPVSTVPAPDTTPEDEKPFATAKEKWTAARDALKPVVEKHAGTGAARLGSLYLADSQAHLGELDDAIASYQKYLRDAGTNDPLRFLALQGLGAAQESKGDLAAAAATFKELTTLPTKQGRDVGYFNAGRVLAAKGDKEGAKASLEKLTKDKEFEGSPLRARAEDLLATVQ